MQGHTQTENINFSETKPHFAQSRNEIFFEIMQSDIHLEILRNPSYEDLLRLIKGRGDINKDTFDKTHSVLRSWAATGKHNQACIVEIRKSNDSKNIAPEDIYKIHPREDYFHEVESNDGYQGMTYEDFKPLMNDGILNPWFDKTKPIHLKPIENREYYLPVFIPKESAALGKLEIDKKALSTLNIEKVVDMIEAASKNSEIIQMGRVVNEAKKIMAQDGDWQNKNLGYLFIKLLLPDRQIGCARRNNPPEYFFTLGKNTPTRKMNILGIEIGSIDSTLETQISNIKNIKYTKTESKQDFTENKTFLNIVENPLILQDSKNEIINYLENQDFAQILKQVTGSVLVTTQLREVNKNKDFLKSIVTKVCHTLIDNHHPHWSGAALRRFDRSDKIVKLYYLAVMTEQHATVKIIQEEIKHYLTYHVQTTDSFRNAILLSRTCHCFDEMKERFRNQIIHMLRNEENAFALLSDLQEIIPLGLLDNKDIAKHAEKALNKVIDTFALRLQHLELYLNQVLEKKDHNFVHSQIFRETMQDNNLALEKIHAIKSFLNTVDIDQIFKNSTIEFLLSDNHTFESLKDKTFLVQKSHYRHDDIVRIYLLAHHINHEEMITTLHNKIIDKITEVLSINYDCSGFRRYIESCTKLTVACDHFDQAKNVLRTQILRHLHLKYNITEYSQSNASLDRLLRTLDKYHLLTATICRELLLLLKKESLNPLNSIAQVTQFLNKFEKEEKLTLENTNKVLPKEEAINKTPEETKQNPHTPSTFFKEEPKQEKDKCMTRFWKFLGW